MLTERRQIIQQQWTVDILCKGTYPPHLQTICLFFKILRFGFLASSSTKIFGFLNFDNPVSQKVWSKSETDQTFGLGEKYSVYTGQFCVQCLRSFRGHIVHFQFFRFLTALYLENGWL